MEKDCKTDCGTCQTKGMIHTTTFLQNLLQKKASNNKRAEKKLKDLIQGWDSNEFVADGKYTHFPLDQTGIEQAVTAAESMIAKEKWSGPAGGVAKDNLVIWTSPLMRTLQTAKVIKFCLEVSLGIEIEMKACPEILEAITNCEGLGFKEVFFSPTVEEAESLKEPNAWSDPANLYQEFLQRAYKSAQRKDLSKVHFTAKNAIENVDKHDEKPATDFNFQPRLSTDQEVTEELLKEKPLKNLRLGNFWKMQDPEFVPQEMRSQELLYSRFGSMFDRLDAAVPKAFPPGYPNYDAKNKYKMPTELGAERFSDIAHRALRIIDHASRQEKEVIMVSHGDICNVAHMYPRLLKEFPNKSDFIYDPRCPHPTKNSFPWFDHDPSKELKGMYAGKASCTTLTFDAEIDTKSEGLFDSIKRFGQLLGLGSDPSADSYRKAKAVKSVQPKQVSWH